MLFAHPNNNAWLLSSSKMKIYIYISTSFFKSKLIITFMASLKLAENKTQTSIESWFIPLDILLMTCNGMAIILAILFLALAVLNRTCRTVSMILAGNSALATLLFASVMLIATSFTLRNDLKQVQDQDSLCVFLGHIIYTTCAQQNYSFVLQAIYRYLLIVHPARLFWHSRRIQLLFICISWIIAFVYPMEFLFTGRIIYDVNNQICQIPLGFSFAGIYMALCVYVIPDSIIIFIYIALVRYVKKMSAQITPINTLSRARSELKMVRRTVILITILMTMCFPYQLFFFLSLFNSAPKYNFRIAFIFGDTSMVFIIMALFQFTDPLKASVLKRINKRRTTTVPAVSWVKDYCITTSIILRFCCFVMVYVFVSQNWRLDRIKFLLSKS